MIGRVGHWVIGCLVGALVLAVGSPWTAPAGLAASAPVALTYLGAPFIDQQTFVKVANQMGESLGLRLEPNWVPFDDVPTKIAVDFRAGAQTWDLVFVYSNWVAQMAEQRMVLPINDFIKTPEMKSLVNIEDFIPIFSKGLVNKNKLHGMPYEAAPFMIGYRSDLFKNPAEQQAFTAKYGYPLAAPQTYKQFMDIAQFFTRKKGDMLAGERLDEDFYGVVAANKSGAFLFNRYKHFMVAFGADLIYDPKTMMPTWNSSQNMVAAKYYVALNKFMPAGNQNMTSGQAVGLFREGRVAMTYNSLDGLMSLVDDPQNSKVIGKVDYALMPTELSSRPHAYVQDANGIGVYGLSRHKDEAFKLIAYALSAKGNKEMLLMTHGLFPTRFSSGNDLEVRQKQPMASRVLRLIEAQKPYVAIVPPLNEWPEAQDIAITSISEALAGQKPVEQALNAAQAKLVDLFKRAGYIK